MLARARFTHERPPFAIEAVRSAGAAARAELLRLFPTITGGAASAYGGPARPYARWRELPSRLDSLRLPGG